MKPMTPNDLGKKFVVEECQKIRIEDYLKDFKHKLKKTILSSVLEANRQQIELTTTKTGFDGTRYWFRCPQCNKRIGTILVHPLSQKIGCRVCLGVDYRARVFKGMIESEIN